MSVYVKVAKVISSCETCGQLRVAYRMVKFASKGGHISGMMMSELVKLTIEVRHEIANVRNTV